MSFTAAFDLNAPRAERYSQLDMQCGPLLDESDGVANQANFSAVVHAAFGWHWVGFYRVCQNELVLGPFQGPVACTRLPKGRGVCAAAWVRNEAVIVSDVDAFPGHVACSPESRSELVIPVRDSIGQVCAVFDVDSVVPGDFNSEDAKRLQHLLDVNAHRVFPENHG